MDTPTRFAVTKIQPPRPRAVRLERAALCEAMVQAVATHRVVLVQAPAGFGKTSALAAAWTQLATQPGGCALAWVSLDAEDDVQRLFACLAAALEPFDLPWRTSPDALVTLLGGGAGEVAQGGDAAPRRAATELLNALAAADVPRGVIVLDDLHRVTDGAVHGLLDMLAERLPPAWTLLLASRTEPPLKLARLRAAGELAEFGSEQLRFSRAEAQALAEPEGVSADGELAAAIFERTQGWPAGLRLALAALRSQPQRSSVSAAAASNASAGARAGSDFAPLAGRHFFDYLASEVLDTLPKPLHDFLVRCAVLPELTAARAAAVSGDAHAALHLDEIERRALFATALQAQERTLVLHDLFRDALMQRLQRDFAPELPQLWQRAAAGETDALRRVGWLMRAQDWAGAQEVLQAASEELFLQGGANEVLRVVAQFPPGWRAGSARLSILAAVAHCLRWQWSEMARACEAALEAARSAGPAADADRQRAMAYLAVAVYPLGRNGQAEALIAALHEEGAAVPLAAATRRIALMAETSQLFRRGEHPKLHAAYAEVLDLLRDEPSLLAWWECAPAVNWSTLAGLPALMERYRRSAFDRLGSRPLPLRAELQVQRAFGLLWQGDIEAAVAAVHEAEDDMRWLAVAGETETGVRLFRLLEGAICGRVQEVQQRLQTMLDRERGAEPERARLWRHQTAVYGVRMSDVLGLGPQAIHDWSRELLERPLDSDEAQNARAIAVRARHALAEERWADAVTLFDRLQPALATMDVMGHRMELQLRGACAMWRAGRVQEAARWLEAPLRRIGEEGLLGPALLAGPQVLGTLAAAADGGALVLPESMGATLRSAAELSARMRAGGGGGGDGGAPTPEPRIEAPPPGAGSEALSEREHEVLERIAAGDSNKLIARALDISPHTVKRHVANILDKLALQSRGQAAACWRAMQPAAGGVSAAGATAGKRSGHRPGLQHEAA